MIQQLKRRRRASICVGTAIGLLALLPLGGCEPQSRTQLEQILERGKLRVVTRNGPITYYRDRGSDTGFEYELVRQFADTLGVELEISIAYGRDELFDALRRGKADIAAAGILKIGEPEGIEFGPGYLSVRQFVLRRRGVNPANGPEDIIGRRVLVVEGSAQEDALAELLPLYPISAGRTDADSKHWTCWRPSTAARSITPW